MLKRIAVLSLFIAALSAGVVFFFLRVSLVPVAASLEMAAIDNLLRILLSISGAIFVLVIVLILYSAIVFRRRRGDVTDGPPLRGHSFLELMWTFVPLAIVVILAIRGGVVLRDISYPEPAGEEMRVTVTAVSWSWSFEYPDWGIKSQELWLPVNRRVVLELKSPDVIHSFWVPEFGPKQDAVPGMLTELRFTPTRLGQYTVLCAELCGLGHTYMTAPVRVTSPDTFQQWVEESKTGK